MIRTSIPAKGSPHVGGIAIQAPSPLKTARGLGLGTSRVETLRLYKDLLSPYSEENEDVIVAGSLYGGMFFGFEGAGVATIYFGSGAE